MLRRSKGIAVVSLLAAFGVVGVMALGRNPGHVPAAPAFDPSDVFDVLRSEPFAREDVPPGFRFDSVAGTLPPAEASERGVWIVYASFQGPADEVEVGFQVFRSAERASDFVSTHFPHACTKDLSYWECAGVRGPVAVTAEVGCLAADCTARLVDAKRLLKAAHRHLERLGI